MISRPDIIFSVSCRFKAKPTKAHYNAVKCIFKYVRGTLDFKLVYRGTSSKAVLTSYTDVDYGGDLETRNSRGGYIMYLNGGPISWGFKNQNFIVDSTTYAKYVACYIATKEIIWCHRLLHGLDFSQPQPTILFSDNQSAIQLAFNPEFHQRTKHVDIKYHMVREQIKRYTFKINYINTADNIADILTKAIAIERFKHLQSLLTPFTIP
jgi:hypothetical protein